jgi:hypothetical protein
MHVAHAHLAPTPQLVHHFMLKLTERVDYQFMWPPEPAQHELWDIHGNKFCTYS